MSFFSWLWVSGMTITVRKPSALPTSARPIPVLPGCALDDYAAGPEMPALHGVLDDEESGPILDRSAGVHELGFAENRAAGSLGCVAEPDQGSVADGGGKV